MIYFDNAATTPMDPAVVETVNESMRRDFANPGTVYRIGLDVKNRIEKAREKIAELLRLPPDYRIAFTSGGSESNNLFIKGICFPDKRAASLGLEHPSVAEVLSYLKQFGNEALRLSHKEARLDLSSIAVLRESRTRLLCLSHVNNELGSVNDPAEILPALANGAPQTRLFLDGVQAVGKLAVAPDCWNGLAGYSISAHKINGPKGVGLLVYDSRSAPNPLIHGGRQQYGVRSGTLPAPLILGLAESLRLAAERLEETRAHLRKLFRCLVDGLRDLSGRSRDLDLRFNSSTADDLSRQSPAIVNFSFPPVEGEALLHHLEEKDIFVGLGSACSAHQSKEPSRILTGVGLSAEEARCSLRVSFGPQNTVEETEIFLDEFARAYQALYPTFRHGRAEK